MGDIKDKYAANIYTTKDYGKFRRLKGNRDVTDDRKNKIKASIEAVGYILSPITVNEYFEVIDGQGRLAAVSEMGLPVYYCISKGAGIKECIAMNIHQSNWRTIDYVKSYAENGNQSYVLLLKLIDMYHGKIPIDSIIGIAFNTRGQLFNAAIVKKGRFVFDQADFQMANDTCQYIVPLKQYLDQIKGPERLKTMSISWIYQYCKYDKERLNKIIVEQFPIIKPVVDHHPELFMQDLSELYNKRLSPKKCVLFDAEYRKWAMENVYGR